MRAGVRAVVVGALGLVACACPRAAAPVVAPVAVVAPAKPKLELRPAAGCLDVLHPWQVHVDVVDALSCHAREPAHEIEVVIDGKSIGIASIDCTPEVQAPPRRFALPGYEVSAGDHVIAATDRATGVTASETVTVPAVVVTGDGGGMFAGAHMLITAEDLAIRIAQPTALPETGI